MLGAQNIFPSSSIVIVNPRIDHRCTNKPGNIIRFQSRAVTVNDAITSDPELTWQIVVGAIAGVAPFVVAGVEFSKRIVEQRNCKVCRGSGLVLRDNKYYFRCPACGGFLPWQSWKRFFTG
ncbi:uncharacterized protein LOC121746863 isoform X2 [Salvia splendens]|uniref:uncharacterized protein LOC121746863 isoform X2 n=1 Tax=Salvia splendens TaxID=180675 RepID=UPI001C27892F|nr:uncharacterized protein LOC121746863 isoform X2 [Salvia splendens]